MSAVFAFPRTKRTAIALLLCVLAFAFAMEAKLACYGPSRGSDNELHAAKACPADAPDLLAQGIQALAPVHSPALIVLFAAFVFFSLPSAAWLRMRALAALHSPRFASRYFFHHLFFRPPPSFR